MHHNHTQKTAHVTHVGSLVFVHTFSLNAVKVTFNFLLPDKRFIRSIFPVALEPSSPRTKTCVTALHHSPYKRRSIPFFLLPSPHRHSSYLRNPQGSLLVFAYKAYKPFSASLVGTT